MVDNVLVLACSGGSDVGELADRAARALKQADTAKMYCLAGIGGQLASMVKTAAAADTLIAIDGCRRIAPPTAWRMPGSQNSGICD